MTRRVVNFFSSACITGSTYRYLYATFFSVRSSFTLPGGLVHRGGKNFIIYAGRVHNHRHHGVDKYYQVRPSYYDGTVRMGVHISDQIILLACMRCGIKVNL